MIGTDYTTDLDAPALPSEENELSRRYLRVIERWLPVGVKHFATWPERPNCGHFLGGCHWYGQESIFPAEALALASTSPEYDEKATGIKREDLRRMAAQAVRYLCFVHDTGPPECVRPHGPMGRAENWDTKWGERGKGFFRESQCGITIAGLAQICLLLRDEIDEETWMMVAHIHEDYAHRFGDLAPRSGVYMDTQMEENGWTSYGLTSAFLFLSRHPDAQRWESTALRWMFSTCATPQDSKDLGEIGESTIRALTQRTFTTLPDYWAENHGVVHPGYTSYGVASLALVGCLLKLWGRELPSELLWNRRRLYENLKALTDGGGYVQAIQGMDWNYLPTFGTETPHAIASVFFEDPDAAALQRRALSYAELRQKGNDGRMYSPDIETAHDIQDPMIMRESGVIGQVARLYLLHRLVGPGPDPTPEAQLEKRLSGVRAFPHAGFVHHRHQNGQTSLSWRNSIMALPLPRDGIYTVAPATNSFLGTPQVRDHPDSHRLRSVRVSEYDDGFAAAVVMDRCQGTLRQEVLFASLPDGRTLSLERFIALEDITMEALTQGSLRITNEHFPLLDSGNRGTRRLYHPGGHTDYKGWIGEREEDDLVDRLHNPPWLNVDDRLGIRFRGTGQVIYRNRHYFVPYYAIVDDLTLSSQAEPRQVRAGQVAGQLAALVCPEQAHADTATATLTIPECRDGTACVITDGYLAVANFSDARRKCELEIAGHDTVPVYLDTVTDISADTGKLSIALERTSAAIHKEHARLRTQGRIRVAVMSDGTAYITNIGSGEAEVEFMTSNGAGRKLLIAPGQTLFLP